MSTEIKFTERDLQQLCKKYFGDRLTRNELTKLKRLYSLVKCGRRDGILWQLTEGILALIGLARTERRSGRIR